MREPDTRDHSGLIAHHDPAPRGMRPLPTPRLTRCTARTYGGQVATVEGVVRTRAAGGLLAFTAEYPGWGEWTAWVRRECCEPL